MNISSKNAKDTMRDMRQSWREVGFYDVLVRVHARDKEMIQAFSMVLTGRRIIGTIEGGGEDALDLALSLSERHSLRGAVTMHELTMWHASNEALLIKDKALLKRYDKTFETMVQHLKYLRESNNADAHMQTQGVSSEKYEESALARGKATGYLYIAHGMFRMLKDGTWVEI